MAKIYVACLASYNAGRHHGAWFDLEDYADAEDLQAAINEKVLLTSPFPNVMVDCPVCRADDAEIETCVCTRCKGAGQVPSSEEFAIHDYDDDEGFFNRFGEYPSLEKLIHHQEMMNEHEGWSAFYNYFGGGAQELTSDDYESAARGKYDKFADFVEEYNCELYGWKGDEPFFSWIDWERAARDMQGDFTYTEGWVFYSNWA